MDKLATQSWLAYQRKASSEQQREQITAHLKLAEVGIRALLGETIITVNELLHLQPGDILTTKKSANAELILQVEDRNKFAGRLYQFKGARALRITRLAGNDESL